jgi:transcriptional regulator with GAF, ATPase, and Fis domain/ligand-binding sensor domain-containing protein/PAS domain-containing protein
LQAAIVLTLVALAIQSHAAGPRSVRFEHVSRDDGLSQSFVYTIVQDDDGFMWFGTQEGLNRFDGYEFLVFANDPGNPTSISDESIRVMIRDSDGTLWVGTDAGGLSRIDTATNTFTNFLHDPNDPASLADNRVRDILEDSSGDLWIGTDGSGLDRFDRQSGTFSHYRFDADDPGSIAGKHVWSILEDSAGTLWVATDGGLSRFDRNTGNFANFRHDPDDPRSLSDNELRAIHQDSSGALWVGTASGGLNRFDTASGTSERFVHDPDDPTSISSNRINTIYEDGAGALWIGTIGGLNTWNPDTRSFARYRHDAADNFSISHDNVLSIYQDRGGVLWIGTYEGLSKWNPESQAFLHFRTDTRNQQSLTENTVTSFAEAADGDIWIGTFGGGLNICDRETGLFSDIRHVPGDDSSLSSDRVMAVHIDADGLVWAGSRASGLNRIDPATDSVTRFRHDPEDPASISADGITYILEDRDNGLWIATFGGGINYFDRDNERFRHYRHDPDNPSTLSSDRILVLFEDSTGLVWAGTYGGGLNRLDPSSGKITHFRNDPDRADSLSGDEIFMIQEDAAGNFWIGAKGAGLNRWLAEDRKTGKPVFQRFTEIDGLPSATVYSGQWDDDGNLWLSTGKGLSRLDPVTLTFRNYDTSHGLQGDEFNLSAGLRASDGQIYFGGLGGFNVFEPDTLNGHQVPPKVSITKFLVMNERASPETIGSEAGQPTLSHDTNVIGFEFAALDYAAPGKTRYMYRLEGLDEDWVDVGTNRQVTYTNLPAGHYTFRVRARNHNGTWSEEDATLEFVMLPAPWKTWWANLLYLALLLAVIYAAIRANARSTERAAKLRYAEEISNVQSRLTEAQRIAKIGNWDWGVRTGELWWSDEIYRMFQINRESFESTYEAFLVRVHPDDRGKVQRAVDRALANERPYSIDHRIVRTDGSEIVVHERAEVSFDDNGKPVRMVGTTHDITDRKIAEDEIHRRADSQALLADLSTELIQVHAEDLERVINSGLERIAKRYGLDAISIVWFADEESMQAYYRWQRDHSERRRPVVNREETPWIDNRLKKGEPIAINDVEHMPAAASTDQELLRRRGTKSLLITPLLVDGEIRGGGSFSMVREQHDWTNEEITELRLLAEKLAGAAARSQALAAIETLKDQLQEENIYLREEVRLAHGFDEIIGEDPGLRRCLQAVEKVAPTDVAVLLLGETGTGKELFARAIHKLSARRHGPMISVNCPALPANLIESELFGHERGAFTGAESQRRGRFEIAEGGTLFLDEIGELPLELQAKLLRVLQTGEFERLGGTKTLHADVRLVAATNRNLQNSIEKGEFRSDLYYRISSFPIDLPALRDRQGDMPLLAEHFVHKHSRRLGKQVEAISAKMLKELAAYSWPGNVRELESIIERALISSNGTTVLDLPGPLQQLSGAAKPENGVLAEDGADLETVERAHIINVLDQTGWRISGAGGAAAILGMPSSTLRSRMKKLGITRKT